MIAYQSSHVKDRLRGRRVDYATGPKLPLEDKLETETFQDKLSFHFSPLSGSEHRLKRQAATGLRGAITGHACPLILVADHTVYTEFGEDERGIIVQLVSCTGSQLLAQEC